MTLLYLFKIMKMDQDVVNLMGILTLELKMEQKQMMRIMKARKMELGQQEVILRMLQEN